MKTKFWRIYGPSLKHTKKNKKAYYLLEFAGFLLFFSILQCIGLHKSRKCLSWLFVVAGPYLPIHKTLLLNLNTIYSEKTTSEIQNLAKQVWHHLGLTIAEIPFLKRCITQEFSQHISVTGITHLAPYIKNNKPFILFSAHYSNWEAFSLITSYLKIPSNFIYRPPNNPYVNAFIEYFRKSEITKIIPKGPKGNRALLRALKNKENFGMLIDQKYAEGLQIPFMGFTTSTTQFPARLVSEHGYTLIPAYLQRTNKGFQLNILPAHQFTKEDTVETITQQLNDQLASWIHQKPEEWLWLHDRWSFRKQHKKQASS